MGVRRVDINHTRAQPYFVLILKITGFQRNYFTYCCVRPAGSVRTDSRRYSSALPSALCGQRPRNAFDGGCPPGCVPDGMSKIGVPRSRRTEVLYHKPRNPVKSPLPRQNRVKIASYGSAAGHRPSPSNWRCTSRFSAAFEGSTVLYCRAKIWLLFFGSEYSTTKSLLSWHSKMPTVGFSSGSFT